VVIDNGQIQLNPPTQGVQAFESVETHGLPSSASLVVQALIPELRGCTLHTSTSASLRMVHVGARIAKDGHVLCTVASSNSHVPVKMRDCAEAVMAAAKFPPPTGDVGLVSVPVNLSRR
jgi:hypothetical protein